MKPIGLNHTYCHAGQQYSCAHRKQASHSDFWPSERADSSLSVRISHWRTAIYSTINPPMIQGQEKLRHPSHSESASRAPQKYPLRRLLVQQQQRTCNRGENQGYDHAGQGNPQGRALRPPCQCIDGYGR